MNGKSRLAANDRMHNGLRLRPDSRRNRDQRVALVIGNSAYTSLTPLQKRRERRDS